MLPLLHFLEKNAVHLLFCIELKVTIDIVKLWFTKLIKPRFYELEYTKKDDWRKKNPLTSDTVCTICDF